MKNEIIALINPKDRKIGSASWDECHKGEGKLHRAFLILIFNDNKELLIQKRSKYKKLWPNFWDGSVASHVLFDENSQKATKRKLKQELMISCKLKRVFRFRYFARYENIGSENEICHVFIGKYDEKLEPNKKEVSQTKFIDLKELIFEMKKNPKKFTPWFLITIKKIQNNKSILII